MEKNLENKNKGLFEIKKTIKKTKQEILEFEKEILKLVPKQYQKN